MASIGVNIYSFHIHDTDGRQLNLNNVVRGKSILDLFEEFINTKLQAYEDNSSNQQIYKFVDYEIVQQKDVQGSRYLKYLYGKMKTGHYGIETEIVDKDSGNIAHTQTEDEAGVTPFDFVIALPEDSCEETIVVLQTLSRYGIKSILNDEFKKFIQKNYNLGYVFFGTIYPREFVQRYVKDGILGKMRLIRDSIPEDMADQFGLNSRGKRAKQEIIISTPLGFTKEKLEKIVECICGKISYTDIVALDSIESYDDIKLEFKLAGKQKTVSLKNLDKVVISEDITDRVVVYGGNPLKESIEPIMVEYAIDYLIEKGLLVEVKDLQNEIISSIPEKDDNDERDNG